MIQNLKLIMKLLSKKICKLTKSKTMDCKRNILSLIITIVYQSIRSFYVIVYRWLLGELIYLIGIHPLNTTRYPLKPPTINRSSFDNYLDDFPLCDDFQKR